MTKGIGELGLVDGAAEALGGRVLRYTQAKVIGGGSTINAQIYTRGNAWDYDAWASEAGCAGWGYADVLPYFKRAEDNQRFVNAYHAMADRSAFPMPIDAVADLRSISARSAGIGIPYNPDFNGATQEGIGYYQVTVRNARRSSAATCLSAPVGRAKDLTRPAGLEPLRASESRRAARLA